MPGITIVAGCYRVPANAPFLGCGRHSKGLTNRLDLRLSGLSDHSPSVGFSRSVLHGAALEELRLVVYVSFHESPAFLGRD